MSRTALNDFKCLIVPYVSTQLRWDMLCTSLGTIENHEITEAVISVIFAVCRDFYQMPWFCWFHEIVQYSLSINCNLCCDFSTKLILSTNNVASRTSWMYRNSRIILTSSLSKWRDEIDAYKPAVMEVDEDVQPHRLSLAILWMLSEARVHIHCGA